MFSFCFFMTIPPDALHDPLVCSVSLGSLRVGVGRVFVGLESTVVPLIVVSLHTIHYMNEERLKE